MDLQGGWTVSCRQIMRSALHPQPAEEPWVCSVIFVRSPGKEFPPRDGAGLCLLLVLDTVMGFMLVVLLRRQIHRKKFIKQIFCMNISREQLE